jgi:hypothetical protein
VPASNPRLSVGASTRLSPGSGGIDSYYFGEIGALWFNTSYIDLSVAANLAKFVTGTGINAKPVDLGATGELPTGTSPLMYLPLYGNNAGKNYGTGGDFTVNSGPYTGARGPNEFWGNKAATSSGYMDNGSISINSSTFTMSFWMRSTSTGTTGRAIQFGQAGASYLYVECAGAPNSYRVTHFNPSTGNTILSSSFNTSAGAYLQFSKSGSTYTLFVNGTSVSFSGTFPGNITNTNPVYLFSTSGGGSGDDLQMAEVYVSTSYVDFTQEANRLKFRDAFGNPTDLPSAITALSVPAPLIYMRFPPTAFGTNSGTGGNFTLNGSFSDGGQL